MSRRTELECVLDEHFEQREKSNKVIVGEARYHIVNTLLALDNLDFDWKRGAVYGCPGNVQGMTQAGLVDYLTGKVDQRFNGADVLKGIKQLRKEGIIGETNVSSSDWQENVYSKTVCYLLAKT